MGIILLIAAAAMLSGGCSPSGETESEEAAAVLTGADEDGSESGAAGEGMVGQSESSAAGDGMAGRSESSAASLDEEANVSAYKIELPVKKGFGQGQDPWEWAEKMYQDSAFVRTEPYETEHVKKTAAMIYRMTPSEDTYANSGSLADVNFGGSDELMVKYESDSSDMARMSFLKFKLDELPAGRMLCFRLSLYVLDRQNTDQYPVNIYLADDNGWSADTLTWNNMPGTEGEALASVNIGDKGAWYCFDLTDAVCDAIDSGKTEISFVLQTREMRHAHIASSRSDFAPYAEICMDDGTRGDVTPACGNDSDQYTAVGYYLDKKDRTVSISVPSRTLKTLSGYVTDGAEPELGPYGGRLDMQEEATGWYYVKKLGDRWWIIDPEGHPMIHMGVATIRSTYGNTDRLYRLMLEKFGSVGNWAEQTIMYLKHDLYFNGGGGWCDTSDLLRAGRRLDEPFAMTEIVYFLKEYMASIGIGAKNGGDTRFANDGLNVFDPDFEPYCERLAARKVARMADEKSFAAWMADNELHADISLLDRFLTADWSDPRNAYSYAAAWTFLSHYTGKDSPSLDDVTDLAREDFLDMVWDRYHRVVSGAIRKYDPNHMYWGSRAKKIERRAGFFSAAGRYCDAFAVNYYGAWTPDRFDMTCWNAWGYGRPFVVTEWYAMAEDADPLLKNSSGAGFLVATQKDRGLFYQNYALKLLETRSCIGFHWFTYMDNDPGASGDDSNVDSNKGLMSTMTYEPYEDLVTEMAELNRQAYRVIDYFDR